MTVYRIRRTGLAIGVAALALIVPGTSTLAQTGVADSVPGRLRTLLDKHRAAHPNVRGEAISIAYRGKSWKVAVGSADAAGAPLTPEHMFRIASMTKPFTAASILRLMEDGAIDITAPIDRYLTPATVAQLKSGGYDPATITVRDLLAHNSGIRDYALDERFVAAVTANPHRRWTRREQIDVALKAGRPLAAPGKVASYSDTGYILLGEIIEQKTGQGLAQAARRLLDYRRLGLMKSWWEQLEPAPGVTPMASAFLGDTDTKNWDPSFDVFGGGGMVSNVEEAGHFYRALVRGDVFRDRATQAVLLTVDEVDRSKEDFYNRGNGIGVVKAGRFRCWGAQRLLGLDRFYCPEGDLTISWTVNQAEGEDSRVQRAQFFEQLVQIVDPAGH